MNKKTIIYALVAIISSAIIVGSVIMFAFRSKNIPSAGPLDGVYIAVSKELFDTESAKFRDVTKVHDTYCGEVDSKNESGEYIGFRAFMVRKTESKKIRIGCFFSG